MNWLDYLLIAILAYSVIQSFRRGIVREIVGICAAIAAILLAMWFYGTVGALLHPLIASARVANLVGFIAVAVIVLILGAIVGRILRGFTKVVGLSFFDRILGAFFGLIRGGLVCVALLTAYISFAPRGESKSAPQAVVHSQIAPVVMEASRVVVDAAPMSLKQSFSEMYDEVRSEIRKLAEGESGKK